MINVEIHVSNDAKFYRLEPKHKKLLNSLLSRD